MSNEFLICTNGHESTWPAIEYGAWAAASTNGRVTLLGVSEHPARVGIDAKYPLEDIFARAVKVFDEKGLQYSLEVQNGDAESVIPSEAHKRDAITVLGRLARPFLRRLLTGRSIRQLMAKIVTPILYVPRLCLPLKKMLVCSGGLGYELSAEQVAIPLGLVSKAQVVLLHVTPPVDLDYPSARTEREQWRDPEKTASLSGRNLRRARDVVQAAGLEAEIRARQGNVVEEIMAEIKLGNYDLVCMGSPYSGHGLRHLYGPNVTDEIAELAPCPILTARYVVPSTSVAGHR
jgi:nucleotide-binding universal stress UspA family protein